MYALEATFSVQYTWLIEWCCTPLLTVFQSYHGHSSHYSCLFWVSPVLGLGSKMSCPRTLPHKNPEDPVWLKPRTPGLWVKHFTTEPCRTPQYTWNLIRLFESMKSWTTLKLGHVRPKLGRVLEQICVRTRTILFKTLWNLVIMFAMTSLKIGHIKYSQTSVARTRESSNTTENSNKNLSPDRKCS